MNSSAFQLTSIVPDSEVSIPGLWRGFEVESVLDCGHVSVCGTDELNHLENSQLNKSPQKELAYFVKHLLCWKDSNSLFDWQNWHAWLIKPQRDRLRLLTAFMTQPHGVELMTGVLPSPQTSDDKVKHSERMTGFNMAEKKYLVLLSLSILWIFFLTINVCK